MIHKTYKAYLFDFDYTLADSSRGIVMCFRNVLAMHGHDGISDESIKRTIGKTLEESFTILTGIDDKETLAAYRKEYVAQADRLMTANTVLFPETLDVLSRLKERGARIGIISTKYRYRIMELLSSRSSVLRRQHRRCRNGTQRRSRFCRSTARDDYTRRT